MNPAPVAPVKNSNSVMANSVDMMETGSGRQTLCHYRSQARNDVPLFS